MSLSSALESVAPKRLPNSADNHGAIMVIGIFMACAMVGLMWYMVGIGDAFIWRDRSQEAADSIAFSSAAIHAHSMNIIAFLNIVMSVLAAIYLLAAIIFNITDFILIIIGRNHDHCHFYQKLPRWGIPPWTNPDSCEVRDKIKDLIEFVLGFFTDGATWDDIGKTEFCTAASFVEIIHDPLADDLGGCVKKVQPGHYIKNYEDKILGPVNYYSAKLQRGIARIGPWAGAVMGTYIGYETYVDRTNGEHRFGTALSPSMATGADIDGYKLSDAQKSIQWLKPDGDPRLGLPIGEMRMGYLCYRDVKWVGDQVLDKLPFIGQIPFIGGIIKKLINGAASSIESWYCSNNSKGFPVFNTVSDIMWYSGYLFFPFGNPYYKLKTRVPPYAFDYGGHPFWNDKDTGGPKVMMEYAENGNDWMQVWGVVFPLNRKEDSDAEHRVAIAGAIKDGKWNESHNSRTLYTEAKNVYYGAAEFYLDKPAAWSTLDVNGQDNNSATFSMKWRSRLRRVHSPAWGAAFLDWVQGSTGLPIGLMTNANFLKVMDFISNYFLDDPQAKYTTAYKALKDGGNHKAGHSLGPDTLVKDAFH